MQILTTLNLSGVISQFYAITVSVIFHKEIWNICVNVTIIFPRINYLSPSNRKLSLDLSHSFFFFLLFFFTCSKNKLEDKWHFTLWTLLNKILNLYTGSSLTNNSKVCTIDMMVSVMIGNIIMSNTGVSACKVH